MPGLDFSVISQLDPELALKRVGYDVKSDFIIAPHFSAVYSQIGEDLWIEVEKELRSGTYETSIPITIEVPKANGLTRPGAILSPKDRLLYQVITDFIAPTADKELDRNRVFSNILIDPPDANFFVSGSDSWMKMQEALINHCQSKEWAIKADIASFFERLYQHNLINLLHSCGCNSNAVSLLEKLLSSWMEKNSHGILIGMFPSDFLGNFYLYGLDSDLFVRDTPFIRYVDDIYIFYDDKNSARKGLMDLCKTLRHEGLHLNDKKTRILESKELFVEETEIDALFKDARDEIEKENINFDFYNFQVIWQERPSDDEREQIEIKAVEKLFNEVNNVDDSLADKIEKFCLPFLGYAGSEAGIEQAIRGLQEKPHLTKVYTNYLSSLAQANNEIINELESIITKNLPPYDWQILWIIASLVQVEILQTDTVNSMFRLLRDPARSIALRALCAIAIGKHGSPGLRRNLRHFYSDEPSDYVRSAILFSTRYFPSPERRTCLSAWSVHNPTNKLIASAVQKLV